ncbi:hypothetical protein HMPREF2943_03105 [Corynebacterium sp. HMSC072D12]|uniref:collagen-like protein n=1 Tax=Corynebacterium sp. HMSC072D12 TaxID=1739447 RepID=UPI0008A1F11F|nr:collagen-like protein [Corynebacterium sp. HMSC072D12]OFQ34015.1 hypothetical protein HMPREF2943_03105 [Corynebacterium sp. HMSC072D12]
MTVQLFATEGELTVVRRLAVIAYGAWNVQWPESVPEDQRPQLADDRAFGYISRLPGGAGRMGRRFVRADVDITAAEYNDAGIIIPHTGYSAVETVLDAAASQTSEEAVLERDITRDGLGGLVPGEDFDVGDLVDVVIWGKVLRLPVTAIEAVTQSGAVIDWSVKVGGQLVADDAERKRTNQELERTIFQERRERQKDIEGVKKQAQEALDAASVAVVDSIPEWATSSSETVPPSAGWSTKAPARRAGQFLWRRDVVEFGDGRVERTDPVVVTGNAGAVGATGPQGPAGPKGEPGSDGVAGKDGLGIKDTVITYAASSSGVRAPTAGWSAQPPAASAGQFVWTRTVLAYTDGTSETVFAVGKIGNTGPKGDTGRDGLPGKDGTKLVSTTVSYAVSSSGTTAPTSGWKASPPAASPGKFMWTRSVWKYSDGTSETGYAIGKIGNTGPKGATGPAGPQGTQGPKGTTGATGPQGVSVKTVTRFWRWSATKPGTPTGTANPSGWSTTQPAYVVGQKLWTTTRTLLSNNTASWSPTTEEASVSAATAISQQAANNKNRVWYAATAPGATKGERAGDTWFRYSGSTIVGQWRWTGSTWTSQKVGNQVIANLDAGKITTGTLDANLIGADSITARHIVAAQPGNMIPNGDLTQGLAGWSTQLRLNPNAQTAVPNGKTLYTPAGLGTIAAHGTENWFNVTPGAQYAFEIWLYGTPGTMLFIECRNQDGQHAGKAGPVANEGDAYTGGHHYFVSGRKLTNRWVRYSCVYTMDENTTRARLANWYFNHQNGDVTNGVVYFGGVSLRPMADASLVVDGSITADKLAAGSITADKIKAGAIDATKVNAEEIFLTKDADASLSEQWKEMQLALSLLQSQNTYLADRFYKESSRKVGFGYKNGTSLSGSPLFKGLFSVDGYSLIAKGAWRGRVLTIDLSQNHGNQIIHGQSYTEIDAGNRKVSAGPKSSVFFEVDPLTPDTTVLRPSSDWYAPSARWYTIPGMVKTASTDAAEVSVTGQVTFTNVHRGATYGIRICIDGENRWEWKSTKFGPLGPLGEPTWSHHVKYNGPIRPSSKVEIQAFCDHQTAGKRKVTTATEVKVTMYSY